jgi:hypothetical protein
MQLVDGFLRVGVAGHLDEREPARAPGRLIAHDSNRVDGANALEQRLQIRFACFERQIADVKFAAHSTSPVVVLRIERRLGALAWCVDCEAAGAGGRT